MKVYVDFKCLDAEDMPSNISNQYNLKVRSINGGSEYRNVELAALADYTKQVRKEVCDKIREWHDEECESLDLDSDFDVGYSGALSNLWGILDQIEGE